MKMKLFVFSVLTLLLLTQGCKDNITGDTLAPIVTLTSPLSKSTVVFGKVSIGYQASDDQGLKNVNVFINGNWHKTFQPVNGQQPDIYMQIDSSAVGKFFSYYLTVVDLSGNVSISSVQDSIRVVITTDPPEAPTGVELEQLTTTVFHITWSPVSAYATSIELWRGTNPNGTFTKIKTTSADSTGVYDTVSSSSPIPRYYYKIRAVNEYGGNFSGVVSITKAPTAPTGIGLFVLSPTIFNIYWDRESVTNATNLELYRKSGVSGTWKKIKDIPVTDNNVNDTVADPNIKYYYKFRAVNNFGEAYSSEFSTTIPSPYSIKLTLLPNNFVKIEWNYNLASINYFRIDRGTNASNLDTLKRVLPSERSWIDSTVDWTSANEYFYKVVAVRGPDTAASDVKSIKSNISPTLQAPSQVSVIATSATQTKLTWTNPLGSGLYIKVERKLNGASTYTDLGTAIPVSGTTGQYYDGGVSAPNTYNYRLRTTDGSYYSNYSTVVTVTIPDGGPVTAPTGVKTTPLGRHKVKVEWNAGTGNIMSYRVERGQSQYQFVSVATVGPNQFSYVDSSADLNPSIQYFYRVSSLSSADSSSSSIQTVTTLDFDAPSNFNIIKTGNNKYKLTWSINWQYYISTLVTVVQRKWVGGGQTTFTTIGQAGYNINEYVDSTVTSPSSYIYRLYAQDGSRASDYSGEYLLQTQPNGSVNAPSNLSGYAAGVHKNTLMWTDNSNNETHFNIERTDGFSDFQKIAQVAANSTSYIDTPAVPSRTAPFTYRIKVFSSSDSAVSNTYDIIPKVPLLAPSDVSAGKLSATTVRITWKNNTTFLNVTVQLERKLITDANYQVIASNLSCQPIMQGMGYFDDTTVGSPNTYLYRLRITDGSDFSAYSDSVQVSYPRPTGTAGQGQIDIRN